MFFPGRQKINDSKLTFSATLLLLAGYRFEKAISRCTANVNMTSVWPLAVFSSYNNNKYQDDIKINSRSKANVNMTSVWPLEVLSSCNKYKY